MKKILAVILVAAVLPVFAPAARAQKLDDLFDKVKASVVVVRSKGRDVSARGVTRFNETDTCPPRSEVSDFKLRHYQPAGAVA